MELGKNFYDKLGRTHTNKYRQSLIVCGNAFSRSELHQSRAKMDCGSGGMMLCLAILLFFFEVQSSQPHLSSENGVKTGVFLSPKVELEPGSFANEYFYGIDFPRGHIAVKSFSADLIDEKGNPVPLY